MKKIKKRERQHAAYFLLEMSIKETMTLGLFSREQPKTDICKGSLKLGPLKITRESWS